MSPLALYIEQVSSHEPMSPSSHPKVAVYPPSPPKNLIFDSLHSAPTLDNTQTNRILVYRGSFNPPHRGHLHLLKHTFQRGGHDLNIIAAIIIPRSDEGVSRKVAAENEKFMFGRGERCLLWKQDLCFPPWAWVYENSTTSFTTFTERLTEATQKDGYSIEFVPLYGAGIASPSKPPGPVYGCQTLIMSDAARAADFQRCSGFLRNFEGCTKWRRIRINEDELRRHVKAKASRALLALKTICPPEAQGMLEDGPAYVEEATETMFAKASEEMKAVLTCQRQVEGRTLTLRFVKCQNVEPRANYNNISSTTVRDVMNKKRGIKLREALDWMVLSADLLWRCKASWIDEARLGTGCCIKFQGSIEELQSPEQPRSYEKPPSFDKPPSLEELWIIQKVEETSPSIEKPPSLTENPTSHEISPSFEEPQSLDKPQSLEEPVTTHGKKRRFSTTGLEADVAVLDVSVGGGVFAEDAEV